MKPAHPIETLLIEDNPGIGMGLMIAHKIIELHGGQIRIVSAHPPATHVLFTLPVR